MAKTKKKTKAVHPTTTRMCCGFVMDRMIATKDGATIITDTCNRCRDRDVATIAAKEISK